MTEQQADALMERIGILTKLLELQEQAGLTTPHHEAELAALTALCKHRDENIECELLELLSCDWDALARFRQM